MMEDARIKLGDLLADLFPEAHVRREFIRKIALKISGQDRRLEEHVRPGALFSGHPAERRIAKVDDDYVYVSTPASRYPEMFKREDFTYEWVREILNDAIQARARVRAAAVAAEEAAAEAARQQRNEVVERFLRERYPNAMEQGRARKSLLMEFVGPKGIRPRWVDILEMQKAGALPSTSTTWDRKKNRHVTESGLRWTDAQGNEHFSADSWVTSYGLAFYHWLRGDTTDSGEAPDLLFDRFLRENYPSPAAQARVRASLMTTTLGTNGPPRWRKIYDKMKAGATLAPDMVRTPGMVLKGEFIPEEWATPEGLVFLGWLRRHDKLDASEPDPAYIPLRAGAPFDERASVAAMNAQRVPLGYGSRTHDKVREFVQQAREEMSYLPYSAAHVEQRIEREIGKALTRAGLQ